MNQNLTICFVRHAQSCQNASLEYRQEFHEDDPPLSSLGERRVIELREDDPWQMQTYMLRLRDILGKAADNKGRPQKS